ncbi:MAG: hypothetical protein R2849_14490 [Thermomicrobiales bacterium]
MLAKLFEKVLVSIAAVPPLRSAPPRNPDELPSNVLREIVTLPALALKIALHPIR